MGLGDGHGSGNGDGHLWPRFEREWMEIRGDAVNLRES